MIGMRVLDTTASCHVSIASWKKQESNATEPVSVLDTHRSPSPSTSTLSGAGSGESHLPDTGFLAPEAVEVAGADDWEALLRWISSEANDDSDQNPFLQNTNLGTQSCNFPIYANETLEDKPQLLNSFASDFQSPSNPVSLIHQPLLQPPNLGNLGNLDIVSSNPKISKRDTQPQTLMHQQPPLKRPNLINLEDFSNNPQVTNLDTHPQNLIHHQPPLKRPNLGHLEDVRSSPLISKLDSQTPSPLQLQTLLHHQPPFKHPNSRNLGNYDFDPRILELDKPSPETLPLVSQQVVYDQLYKAFELILAGNLSNAHSILARLNHQHTPGTKPFQRASFYLKEALGSAFSDSLCKNPTPVDGLFKIGAFKLFSEVSPLSHFINFTSNQAILEAVGESQRIHVIDFDIGSGSQWASFMAELPSSGGSPCLKITAFAWPSSHHPFELGLMHENLTQFANEIGVNFELEVVNLDTFDLSAYPVHLFKSSDKETTLTVNFPIWAFSNRLSSLPSLIRFIKQLSPKIVVSMERGCERTDLPFSHHLLHSLQYYEVLLDSIDASNANLETVSKIEKFIIQPKIENIVLGRLSYPDQMTHWRALFRAAGFSQVNISNINETQAECVVAKTQVRGFRVEKRQASLVLSWQCRELLSASAWRC